jgi:hypothetical protein
LLRVALSILQPSRAGSAKDRAGFCVKGSSEFKRLPFDAIPFVRVKL